MDPFEDSIETYAERFANREGKVGMIMANSVIQDEISKELEYLPFDMQKRVLEFVRSLLSSSPAGVTGKELLKFAGTFTDNEACEIKEIIEKDCEKIDISKW